MKKAATTELFTVTGLRHIHQHTENQDCVLAGSTPQFTAALLADGVSSVRFGGEGARAVCGELLPQMLEHGAFLMACEEEKLPDFLLGQALKGLRSRAGERPLREFASTLAGMLVDNRTGELLYFSLGDSLGLLTKDDRCLVLDAPENSTEGCRATISADAQKYMRLHKLEPEQYDTAVFFTDGAWHHIYNGIRLRAGIKDMLIRQDYAALGDDLTDAHEEDDCSFAAMIRRPAAGRENNT